MESPVSGVTSQIPSASPSIHLYASFPISHTSSPLRICSTVSSFTTFFLGPLFPGPLILVSIYPCFTQSIQAVLMFKNTMYDQFPVVFLIYVSSLFGGFRERYLICHYLYVFFPKPSPAPSQEHSCTPIYAGWQLKADCQEKT